MATSITTAEFLTAIVSKFASGESVELTPITRIDEIPIDSLGWIDLLYELETSSGIEGLAIGSGTTLGEVAQRLGITWETP